VRNRIYAATAVSAVLFLAGCEGDDGFNGIDGLDGLDGEDGFNSLVAFRDVPVGDAVCLGGGSAIDSGLDTNRNDILDADEVMVTEYTECAVTPTLRALHAAPDAPKVNIWVDGAPALTDVDYNQGSGLLGVGQAENVTQDGADVNVQLEAIFPGDDAVVFEATLPLDFGTETTVIACGTLGGGDFMACGDAAAPIVVTNPAGESIADGSFRAQVVHASPSAPPVDVYVTVLDGALENPVNGGAPLAFGDYTGQLEVPAGPYQLRVAIPNDGDPIVVYDSGEIPLPAGADLLIVATENVFLGDSAVQLIVLDGATAAPLYDANTPAGAVAVHLSPDAPAVDILADVGSTPEAESIKLVENVSYTQFCSLEEIGAPEDYTLSVVATGDTASVLDIPYSAVVNEAATVIVSGLLSTDTLTAIPLAIDGRSVFTEAKVRLTHGSPSTPNVDIYILPEGTMIGDEGADPAFTDVPFGADTGVLSVDTEQNLDIYVTGAGDTTPAISVTGFDPVPGMVLDVVARDADPMNVEETGPQVLLIDYDTLNECVVAAP
jgi:hypothetical protein